MIKIGMTEIGQVKLGETNVPFVKNGNKFIFPYDAEIEYLETTGTQWINTNYYIKSYNIKIESKLQKTENTSNIKYLTGVDLNYSNYRIGFYSNASNRYGVVYGANYQAVGNADTNAHELKYDNGMFYVDNVLLVNAYRSYDFHQPILPLGIFCYNSGLNCIKSKLFYYKLYENNVIVRDFIPVRVGQVGYLYDKISGQLFGNAGTGDFILGPDKI